MKRINSLSGFNKKANALLDTTMIAVVIFLFTMMGVVGYLILDKLNTDFQSDVNWPNESKVAIQQLTTDYPTWLDNVAVFIFAMMWIIALVGAYLIDTHPVFFVVIVIGMILLLGAMAYITNAFHDVFTSTGFLTYYGQLTKINFIIDHMLLFLVAIGFSIVIVMVGKPA